MSDYPSNKVLTGIVSNYPEAGKNTATFVPRINTPGVTAYLSAAIGSENLHPEMLFYIQNIIKTPFFINLSNIGSEPTSDFNHFPCLDIINASFSTRLFLSVNAVGNKSIVSAVYEFYLNDVINGSPFLTMSGTTYLLTSVWNQIILTRGSIGLELNNIAMLESPADYFEIYNPVLMINFRNSSYKDKIVCNHKADNLKLNILPNLSPDLSETVAEYQIIQNFLNDDGIDLIYQTHSLDIFGNFVSATYNNTGSIGNITYEASALITDTGTSVNINFIGPNYIGSPPTQSILAISLSGPGVTESPYNGVSLSFNGCNGWLWTLLNQQQSSITGNINRG